MRIYTKSGDEGETGLFGNQRVSKDHCRIEAYGTVDEVNALLGLVRAESPTPAVGELLEQVQSELFCLGAELATPDPSRQGTVMLSDVHVEQLERQIDHWEANLPPLKQFILPGGDRAAATLHVARTVCRRAERRVVTLANQPQIRLSGVLVRYLNRLGDLLFVLARHAQQASGIAEVTWKAPLGGQRDRAD